MSRNGVKTTRNLMLNVVSNTPVNTTVLNGNKPYYYELTHSYFINYI